MLDWVQSNSMWHSGRVRSGIFCARLSLDDVWLGHIGCYRKMRDRRVLQISQEFNDFAPRRPEVVPPSLLVSAIASNAQHPGSLKGTTTRRLR